MSSPRRAFVQRAVVLPIALAALPSARIAALAQAGLAAGAAAEPGSYVIVRTAGGQTVLHVDAGFIEPKHIVVVRHPDGSGEITMTGRRRSGVLATRSKRLDAAQVALFFDLFTD